MPPVHQSAIGSSHLLLGIAALSGSAGTRNAPGPPKRSRKEHGANWNPLELEALFQVKQKQFIEEAESIDGCHLMKPNVGKWLQVSEDVWHVGASPSKRDGPACKSKWHLMISEYKHIEDFLTRSETNDLLYWDLLVSERKAKSLPCTFGRDIFFQVHNWYET